MSEPKENLCVSASPRLRVSASLRYLAMVRWICVHLQDLRFAMGAMEIPNSEFRIPNLKR